MDTTKLEEFKDGYDGEALRQNTQPTRAFQQPLRKP